MKNWLATIRQTTDGGLVNATVEEQRQVIKAGFTHFLHRARNPQTGQVFVRPPLEGVVVIRNERMFMAFIAMCVSEGIELGRWGGHRWYYPCGLVPTIEQTLAWRSIDEVARPQNFIPRVGHSADIWHFENADWTLCELYLCLR